MHKNGFTLIEVIISAVIMVLLLTGLANIFVGVKKHVLHARSRMSGGEIGKIFLDPFQGEVRQDTWDQAGNLLRLPVPGAIGDTRSWAGGADAVDNITFTPGYIVSRVPIASSPAEDSGLRRVKITLNWTEE